tara:strand:- start:3496 stop:3939 length:444 start_codon:yes stop_codon:yes gene_type:complete
VFLSCVKPLNAQTGRIDLEYFQPVINKLKVKVSSKWENLKYSHTDLKLNFLILTGSIRITSKEEIRGAFQIAPKIKLKNFIISNANKFEIRSDKFRYKNTIKIKHKSGFYLSGAIKHNFLETVGTEVVIGINLKIFTNFKAGLGASW